MTEKKTIHFPDQNFYRRQISYFIVQEEFMPGMMFDTNIILVEPEDANSKILWDGVLETEENQKGVLFYIVNKILDTDCQYCRLDNIKFYLVRQNKDVFKFYIKPSEIIESLPKKKLLKDEKLPSFFEGDRDRHTVAGLCTVLVSNLTSKLDDEASAVILKSISM